MFFCYAKKRILSNAEQILATKREIFGSAIFKQNASHDGVGFELVITVLFRSSRYFKFCFEITAL